MANRIAFSSRTHGNYPTAFTEYSDLAEHPKDRTEEYRKDATSGSILIPLLTCWLSILEEFEALGELEQLTGQELEHCTLQLWLPDLETEKLLYVGRDDHGVALNDLEVSGDGSELRAEIADACKRHNSFDELSAIKSGHWPIILTACRHYRMPVPPHFWIGAFV
jgi:hypothetical protein